MKYILGWTIYGTKYTTQLPPKQSNEICKTILSILKQEKISLNKFQKLVSKLQHASFGMPIGRGLFIPIHQAMVGIPPLIILKPSIKKALTDWRSILTQISAQPTSVLHIVK